MTDMDKLIAAVEAGTISGKTPHANLPCKALDLLGAYAGSLDAALRLHEALLPGWTWALQNGAASVINSGAEVARVWDVPIHSAEIAANPARAWLLAVLKALRAKDASNE